jgi:hypothetical protein
MFRALLCPSSREQEQNWLKLHVKMPGCAGCGCVEPWCRQCALFESCFSTAVEQQLSKSVLLMMGMMMP